MSVHALTIRRMSSWLVTSAQLIGRAVFPTDELDGFVRGVSFTSAHNNLRARGRKDCTAFPFQPGPTDPAPTSDFRASAPTMAFLQTL